MITLPSSLLQSLKSVPGFDKDRFIAAHQLPAVTSVRLHPIKKDITDDNQKVPWCAEGRYLEERPVFTVDPSYHAGAYYVQEASSMFLDHCIRNTVTDRSNIRVLDLCAAPGGKSTLIASLLGYNSLLVSNEVIRTRASILEENMTRWGYANTWVTSNDPRDLGKLEGYFDIIVVDAPCSGSGLFRKDAKALQEWSDGNVNLCSQRQQRILADIWPALNENGLLVYATCSYSPEEDEQILDWLGDEYSCSSLSVPVEEEWGIIETVSSRHGFKGYRFLPGNVKGEGFFIALLKKEEATTAINISRFKSNHDKKIAEVAKYLLRDHDFVFLKEKEHYSIIQTGHEADLELLKKYTYLRKTGTAIGNPTAKEWLPAHDLALSIHKSANIPAIVVNKEEALRFLKKDELGLMLPKGWWLINYHNQSLGWIKSIGNRNNNYLPKHWRIRMALPDEDWAQ